jgi:hypothetical protein
MSAIQKNSVAGAVPRLGYSSNKARSIPEISSLILFINHTLEQTIGPQTLAIVSTARQWLSRAAARRGFENFDIVVERLGDDGLLVESIRSGSVVDNVIADDVDA